MKKQTLVKHPKSRKLPNNLISSFIYGNTSPIIIAKAQRTKVEKEIPVASRISAL
jgi:hypothetical protein